MPIEVERKAVVRDEQHVVDQLRALAVGVSSTYRDVYYDWDDRALERDGRRELRLRVVEVSDGSRTAVLTYKGAMLDGASTPEFETEVSDPEMMDTILTGLGLGHTIAYQKRCQNFRFTVAGRAVVATVVRVPELEPTFVEVESIVETAEEIPAASTVVDQVLADLGVSPVDVTEEFYIDMVTARRAGLGA
ncbi:hypothetical protein Lfu02_44870 [Longispora fulva]|uniref:Adenylate cyclase class 2 n=1 Tax=Longispora fulva TaxID=619741 RepID=A0A8J7GH42_9ACTN|nr:class IV adenylate cyclase [Longispora fulva]MBG6137861.1 adenylate cyclase class 2 [Longispora fulva]GIG60115.1 hypothetical protein Lfu02_44870 [Longispora fulva]